MAPSRIDPTPSGFSSEGELSPVQPANGDLPVLPASTNGSSKKKRNYLLGRRDGRPTEKVVGHEGHYLVLRDGRRIFEACGGAAVTCAGQGTKELHRRFMENLQRILSVVTYVYSGIHVEDAAERFAEWLIESTGFEMDSVWVISSGSDATEAAIKMARQYHMMNGEKRRIIMSREGSYHGNTIAALGISGHKARREIYADMLPDWNYQIPSCNAYRQQLPGESNESFVARKVAEFEAGIQACGPQNVAAFFCEPIVGAALGCVPCVPGYLKAMKATCEKYGILFVLDEIMCGMGRTGTMHVWQDEDVVPDIQLVGKCLGGGFADISALLIHQKVADKLNDFQHGHTFQNFPRNCADAFILQEYIQEHDLLSNVRKQGEYMGQLLKERLGHHPHVGDIRGRGLFWGIDFVKDKETKEPFPREEQRATGLREIAYEKQGITFYPGQGSAEDGWGGDHLIVAPAFTVETGDVELIVGRLVETVREGFPGVEF